MRLFRGIPAICFAYCDKAVAWDIRAELVGLQLRPFASLCGMAHRVEANRLMMASLPDQVVAKHLVQVPVAGKEAPHKR